MIQEQEALLAKIINNPDNIMFGQYYRALLAVVNLHYQDHGTPDDNPIYTCDYCKVAYPCATIQVIERALT